MDKTKKQKVLKTTGVLFGILVAMFFCEFKMKIYVPILIMWWVLYNIEKRFSYLDNKLESTYRYGGIVWIKSFRISFGKPFLDTLKAKLSSTLGLNDSDCDKIIKGIGYTRIEFKIEHHANDLLRFKQWGKREFDYAPIPYYEEDNPSTRLNKVLYNVQLSDFCPEREESLSHEWLNCSLDFHEDRMIICLHGDKFKGCVLPEGNIYPKKENILFEIGLNDFKELEKYHLSNFDEAHDQFSPYYYGPSAQERKYTNMFTDNPAVYWKMELFDSLGTMLPKLPDKEQIKDGVDKQIKE